MTAHARVALLCALVLLTLVPTTGISSEHQGPNAFFTVSPSQMTSGDAVSVDASGSTPSRNATTITQYAWRWQADGPFQPGPAETTHTYPAPGTYVITLRITDDAGQTAQANQTVLVQGATPSAYAQITTRQVDEGTLVEADAGFSEPSPGAQRIVAYEWRWERSGNFTQGNATETHLYTAPGQYTITVRVTDDAGRQA
ncbi:MAG: PKD domain-containing protein, partial [Candidatus Thermoplasmatota archaeon]|nr:PKD domain-containing protein [Candidatus Thermoplasmatota archaeon]